MKKIYKQVVAIIVMVSLTIVCFAIPASAMDSDRIIASPFTSFYDIEVGGVIYNVTITRNPNGTRNVWVAGNGTSISWTTKVTEVEPVPAAANVESNSYDSYRYTFCETAATAWYLYRPLQDDGSAATKGIDDPDSEFARRFADEVDNMNEADERISQYLKENDIASDPGTQIMLSAAENALSFVVATTMVAAVIAGIVGTIINMFVVPAIYQAVLAELIEDQYYNIRTAMLNANNYFELA